MLNRPYTTTFNREFDRALFSESGRDQIFKLTRNFVSSLYLGSGVPRAKLEFGIENNTRESYLEWVRQWKLVYNQLSNLIRIVKNCQKTVNYNVKMLQDILPLARGVLCKSNLRIDELREIIVKNYAFKREALIECAHILLNARYNAKLASIGSKMALQSVSKTDRSGFDSRPMLQ